MIKKKGHKEAKQEKNCQGKRYNSSHPEFFKFVYFVGWYGLYKFKMPVCSYKEKSVRNNNENPVPVF